MTWLNPLAWLGLLALAVPVVIHFLGRRSARIRRFPTLRFVGASRLMATRWTKPSDLALLAVRIGILAAAVGALAQPLLLIGQRQGDRARSIARAIIIDTSESMRRPAAATSSTARAVDVARAEAQRVVADARTSVFIHTAAPAQALAGAVGWLGTQRGRRELVVISDFQVGTLDEADLRAVPREIGLELVRVDGELARTPMTMATRQDSAGVTASITVDSVSTRVEWTLRDPAAGPVRDGVATIPGTAELIRANAARTAALLATATLPADTGRPVAVIHREYGPRVEHLRDAAPLNATWQGDIVARLRADPMLAAAASTVVDGELPVLADSVRDPPEAGSPVVVIARSPSGIPVALAARVDLRGVDWLLLFSQTEAGSLASAALIAATMRATARPILVEELEPATVPEQILSTWRRQAESGPEIAGHDSGVSDGRWLWLLALSLLGLETWMRRERRAADAPVIARDRAA